MPLNPVTPQNLKRLINENTYNPREFCKKILPRVQNENPLYLELIRALSDMLQGKFWSLDPVFKKELNNLVLYLGMVCFRALELAQLDDDTRKSGTEIASLFMQDPDLNFPIAPNVTIALQHAKYILTKISEGSK